MIPERSPYGLYVHVPWCRVSCSYCAFYHRVDRGGDRGAFVDAVLAERETRRDCFPGRPTTLSFGGGTPSRLGPADLARLIAALGPGDPADGAAEVGIEANPEDVDPAWLEGALAAGVTRISLGVQTFEPAFARLLRRAHSVPRAREVITRVAAAPGLRSWSVDLMFALPGQTLPQVDADLDALLELGPPHVSLYGLTFEPGTALALARRRGRVAELDEDAWRAMYDRIVDRLEAAGLARYEVSNFARPGHRSEHNRGYWIGRPYLGLGPAAHSFAPDGRRWANPPDLDAWMERPGAVAVVETPTPEQAAVDHLVGALRWVEGADLDELAARSGLRPDPAAISRLRRAGLVAVSGARLTLTRDGYPVADGVVAAVTDALRPAGGPHPAAG